MSQSSLILYIETNFLLSIATGRDPDAIGILADVRSPNQLVLPQVCFMEAFSVLNEMHKSRNRFRNQLEQQISERRRDSTSEHARELVSLLEQSKIAIDKLIEDIDARLFDTVGRLCRDAVFIEVNQEILERQLESVLVEDPTDNLILHCILAHAREHPLENKAFLTGDKAFGDSKVQDELSIAGVRKSFREGKQFRMWFDSQPRS